MIYRICFQSQVSRFGAIIDCVIINTMFRAVAVAMAIMIRRDGVGSTAINYFYTTRTDRRSMPIIFVRAIDVKMCRFLFTIHGTF